MRRCLKAYGSTHHENEDLQKRYDELEIDYDCGEESVMKFESEKVHTRWIQGEF